MKITKREFGRDKNGVMTHVYTLTNRNGMAVEVSNHGAVLVSIRVRDRDGQFRDVALGYDDVSGYETSDCHFGEVVGRNCNRVQNGRYMLNGVTYEMEKNDGAHNLHSGSNNVGAKNWTLEALDEEKNSLTLAIVSGDMEQDYPGTMTMRVTYTLVDDDSLHLLYTASADADTVANLTNHVYFNLNGHGSGRITGHKVRICASAFTEWAEGVIATGKLRDTAGTVFDFREMRTIGDRIEEDDSLLHLSGGYDLNYAVDGEGMRLCAEAAGDESGIWMTCESDLPGLEFYTGNYMKPQRGKGGASYDYRGGFCLETEYFPDAMNHPEFRQPILRAGEEYRSETIYRFSVEK